MLRGIDRIIIYLDSVLVNIGLFPLEMSLENTFSEGRFMIDFFNLNEDGEAVLLKDSPQYQIIYKFVI